MKCLASTSGNKIVRVTNKSAQKLVKSGTFEYIPKWMWKKHVRGNWSGSKGKLFE